MQGGVSPRCGGIALSGAGCARGPLSLRSVRFPHALPCPRLREPDVWAFSAQRAPIPGCTAPLSRAHSA
eukprot:1692604-Pleurochrysis_carterae.AAC.1